MILFKKVSHDEFKKIYEDMLRQFPTNELKSYDHLFLMQAQNNYSFYSIVYNDTNVGYISIFSFHNFLWIDYFAIYKEFHSKGFGSMVLTQLKKNFDKFRGCFLEVEKVTDKDINTKRRADFYIKQGAKKLNVRYFFPSKIPFEMDLYYIPYNPDAILSEEIRDVVKGAFLSIHSDIDNIDEIFLKIEF